MSRNTFFIDSKPISLDSPTYFIADVAANHDGSLEKAKELIYLSAEAGADAVGGSGLSVITASVVNNKPAILAAF